MAKTDPKRLKFLMDVDEAIQAVAKEHPSNNTVTKIKDRFYSLANQEFTRSTLREIHELTIEEVLETQAQHFYKNFPPDIQKELVHTFIEMEHQRRRDNFLEFCLFLFKQIECYVNYLFQSGNLLNEIIKVRKDRPFTSENLRYDTAQRAQIRYDYFHGFDIQSTILKYKKGSNLYSNTDYEAHFNNSYNLSNDIKRAEIMTKFRVISYILLFNFKVDDKPFDKTVALFYEIYQLRNAAHGGKFSEIKQKLFNNQPLEKKEQILYDAWQNRYVNYLKYMGFLVDFMQKVLNSPNLNLV